MAAQKEKEVKARISLQNWPRWEHLSMAVLQPQVIWLTFNKILGDDGGREQWELLFHIIFLYLPFLPLPALLSPYWGCFIFTLQTWISLYFKAWQFWSMGGSVSLKRTVCRTEMQTPNFCPKKSCLFQWTFSGSPGSTLDSFSSCSTVKQYGRANTGKGANKGSRERGSPRKVSRSNVLTIFLCLTSFTLSLSLSDHCRMRWHSPRNRYSGETDWWEENSGSKIRGISLGKEAPWMPMDPADHQRFHRDGVSAATGGGGGRVHVPEDKSCSALTEDLC